MTALDLLEALTGQSAPIRREVDAYFAKQFSETGIGYSQFNELLLFVGYDRVTPSFFQYLLDGTTNYQGGALQNEEQLKDGVRRFRIHAMLLYGSIRYGFKHLSRLTGDGLDDLLAQFNPENLERFSARHPPLVPVDLIQGNETYYLGYLIEREIDECLKKNPRDSDALAKKQRRASVIERGRRNHEAYLTSDHMDVYVATSMRQPHEYRFVSDTVNKVFNSDRLKPLKLRWFDPTQAYCDDRIDKGLAEALMLKRAECTLYLAQETDTFGKDSELASTLAQGKPVIAYVPESTPQTEDVFANTLLDAIKTDNPGRSDVALMLDQLRVFDAASAWKDAEVMAWVANPKGADGAMLKKRLARAIREHYNSRAKTLKETHPLGIQVNLSTGVANGALVARTPAHCADLIFKILTRQLELDIDEKQVAGKRYLLLREKTSNSVFRVVTGDALLTNSFWNYYVVV